MFSPFLTTTVVPELCPEDEVKLSYRGKDKLIIAYIY